MTPAVASTPSPFAVLLRGSCPPRASRGRAPGSPRRDGHLEELPGDIDPVRNRATVIDPKEVLDERSPTGISYTWWPAKTSLRRSPNKSRSRRSAGWLPSLSCGLPTPAAARDRAGALGGDAVGAAIACYCHRPAPLSAGGASLQSPLRYRLLRQLGLRGFFDAAASGGGVSPARRRSSTPCLQKRA